MNEVAIEWANIELMFPEITTLHQTRGYTTEEIRHLLDYSTDVATDFLILAESSSGMRIGGWKNQVWGNIRPIYEIEHGIYTHDKSKSNGKIVCASMIVYNDTSSKHLVWCQLKHDSHANLIWKERLFGHKIGVTNLDNSYFFSEIEESIPQYLVAISDLMFSDEYRTKHELELIQNENTKLQNVLKEKEQTLEMIELKAKFDRFEVHEWLFF